MSDFFLSLDFIVCSSGLSYLPTVGDNCVHASASPFEGLAERMNWLKVKPEEVNECVLSVLR